MTNPFNNDMFSLVYAAFRGVYTDKNCKCQWVEHIYAKPGVEVWGETVFPENGRTPVVSVSAELPVKHAVEILAHELAHVAVGPEHEHDTEWEEAFENIYRTYVNLGNHLYAQRTLRERE